MTRSKIRDISTIPNHRVEIQIPQRNMNINNFSVVGEDRALFTIGDTMLRNHINSLNKKGEVADFLLTTTTINEPNTFPEAMNSPNSKEWLRACLEEVNELEKQHTYDIVDLPKGKTALKGRWVFKEKPINNATTITSSYITNSENTIRYKARWVI
jgi:hypothetical protein